MTVKSKRSSYYNLTSYGIWEVIILEICLLYSSSVCLIISQYISTFPSIKLYFWLWHYKTYSWLLMWVIFNLLKQRPVRISRTSSRLLYEYLSLEGDMMAVRTWGLRRGTATEALFLALLGSLSLRSSSLNSKLMRGREIEFYCCMAWESWWLWWLPREVWGC